MQAILRQGGFANDREPTADDELLDFFSRPAYSG